MFHCTCVWLFMDHIYNCHIYQYYCIDKYTTSTISLLSCISKALERLVFDKISDFVFQNCISHCQFGLYVTVPHCSSFSSILIFYILPLITASNIREIKDAQGLDKTTSSSPNQFPLSHAHYLLLLYLLSNFKLSKGTQMESNIL